MLVLETSTILNLKVIFAQQVQPSGLLFDQIWSRRNIQSEGNDSEPKDLTACNRGCLVCVSRIQFHLVVSGTEIKRRKLLGTRECVQTNINPRQRIAVLVRSLVQLSVIDTKSHNAVGPDRHLRPTGTGLVRSVQPVASNGRARQLSSNSDSGASDDCL